MVAMLVPAAAGATWSQENADANNQGKLARATPSSLGGASFTRLDGRVIAQVTEGPAGLALAGTLSGTVYAIEADGEVAWQTDVDAPMRTAPLWTGEVVVAVPRGDTAYAFTPEGEVAWTLPIENERPQAVLVRMASPIEHPSGDVLIATMAGEVHRVAANGSLQWSYDFGGDNAVEATPVVAPDGDVIAAAFVPGQSGNGWLARLDKRTGADDCSDCWRRQLASQVVGAPTVVADVVLVPLRDANALEARSLADGTQRWETAFDDSIPASPSLHEGLAIVGDIRGTVRGVEIAGGDIRWSFNPVEDDANADTLQTGAYTVADSVAVDADGVAWTPFWVADLSGADCCPPQDSTSSPFYRLDASTGEMLSRERYPKANHGPSLLKSGVWAGSDEGGVRTWSRGSTLSIEAFARSGEALLVVNTDRTGSWSISWDANTTAQGEGSPPTFSAQPLSEGEHDVTVTVDGARASTTVQIDAPDGSSREGPGPSPGPNGDEPPSGGSGGDEGGSGPASNESRDPSGAGDARGIPLSWIAAVSSLLVAAGVHRRG